MAGNEVRIEVIAPERFAQIKKTWVGSDGRGLAVTGNESYRQVGELIEGYEELRKGITKIIALNADRDEAL